MWSDWDGERPKEVASESIGVLTIRVVRGGKAPSLFRSFEDDKAIHRNGAVAARSNSPLDISETEKVGKKSEFS